MRDPVLDMVGNELREGDLVVYGKSNRHDPINIGRIELIDIGNDEIHVLGRGNSKTGITRLSNSSRMLQLGDNYEVYL